MRNLLKFILLLFMLLPIGLFVLYAIPEFATLIFCETYWHGYWNSVLLTIPIVILQVWIAALAAFGFTRWKGAAKDGILLLYCLLTLLPYQVMLLPNYMTFQTLGILNTRWAIWLPGIFSPLPVFLLTRQMQTISQEQIDAAMLDGVSEWVLFRKIFVPQTKAMMCIAAIISFIDCWGIVELPAVLLSNTDLQPLSILLAGPAIESPYAGAVAYLLPPVILFCLFSNRIRE